MTSLLGSLLALALVLGDTQVVEVVVGTADLSPRVDARPASSYVIEVCADAPCTRLSARPARGEQTSWSPAVPLVRVGISGIVEVDGHRAATVPVVAYRDDGNGKPDDDDVRVAVVTTTVDGHFVFAGLAPGLHWLAIEPRRR